MVFLLSNQNIFQYLSDRHLWNSPLKDAIFVESKSCKNFNLLIRISDHKQLLVKQEPHDRQGFTKGDVLNEWIVYSCIQNCLETQHLRSLVSDPIYCDTAHSILVFNYLTRYRDLDNFYTTDRVFPTAIAITLGVTLAEVHRATLDRHDFKQLLLQTRIDNRLDDRSIEQVPNFCNGLDRLEPEILGKISADGLKFYQLYQRYDSLRRAIANLNEIYTPCCLIHRDLKFNNILLHTDWQPRLSSSPASLSALLPSATEDALIRLIDWEKWVWGDAAVDLGALVASYLKIWLRSLTVRANMSLDTALRLAGTPLEALQPSLRAMVQAYLAHAPEVSARLPNFLQRVMQFAGLDLIESIHTKLQYQEPFGNIEICMLQVAKTLLCAPEQAIFTVFGVTEAELRNSPLAIALENCPIPISQLTESVTPESTQIWVKPDLDWSRPLSSEAMLEDLVHHIQIHSDGTIAHPHYPPAEEPEGLRDRLQHLPSDLQRFYQQIQLRNYLYDIYFSGELQPLGMTDATAERLENNTVRGVNVQFYDQLHRCNQGKGYFDPGWQVIRQHRRYLTVQKGGLTLQIQPHRHLKPEERSPLLGDTVAIRLPPNAVEPGFYVAVGNAGLIPEESAAVELSFNIDPDGAIALMQQLTKALNTLQLPFIFKVLSDPDSYDRYDAGVLQIERHQYSMVQPVLQTIYLKERSHFGQVVPLLMKPLAPGLGLAEEPDEEPDDFGLNRCHLLAEALLAASDAGETAPELRLKAIHQHFEQVGIGFLQQPYLNPDSEDIYWPLECYQLQS